MFRAVLFSIVLTLAMAPQATLLCKFWCPPSDAATSGCQHHDHGSSAAVKSDDSCRIAALNIHGFIREDGPRVATSSDVHAVPIPRYRFVRPASGLRLVESSERAWALERRPLETSLRL